MADFEPYLRGEKTLAQLQAEGVDIGAVKHASRRHTKHGIEATVELRDLSGEACDLIMDLTEGQPVLPVRLQVEPVKTPTSEETTHA